MDGVFPSGGQAASAGIEVVAPDLVEIHDLDVGVGRRGAGGRSDRICVVEDFVDDDGIFEGEGIRAAECRGVWIEPASDAVRTAAFQAIIDSSGVDESGFSCGEKKQAVIVVGGEAERGGIDGCEGSRSEAAGRESVVIVKSVGGGDHHAAECCREGTGIMDLKLERGRSGGIELI